MAGVMETEAKWYVLHTFSNYEKVAKEIADYLDEEDE